VILKLNRLTKIFNYIVSSLIIISSTIVFFQVSLPLFDLNITEVDKKKVIGMKTSVPIEFDGELEFWWLLKPETTLNFANASDEKINGIIILELTDNPCKYKESLKIVNESVTQKTNMNPNTLTEISIPLKIDPKSSQSIEIMFENSQKCLVKNGDERDFGAKLVNWKYE
jgi:hypothetical protein